MVQMVLSVITVCYLCSSGIKLTRHVTSRPNNISFSATTLNKQVFVDFSIAPWIVLNILVCNYNMVPCLQLPCPVSNSGNCFGFVASYEHILDGITYLTFFIYISAFGLSRIVYHMGLKSNP